MKLFSNEVKFKKNSLCTYLSKKNRNSMFLYLGDFFIRNIKEGTNEEQT